MNHVCKIHARIIKLGYHKDPFHLRHLLLSCASSSSSSVPEILSYAASIFDCIPSPDTVSWNSIIRIYSNSSSSPFEALSLFSKMCRGGGVSPDHYTFPFVLKSCARLQRGPQEIQSLIVKLGFDSDIFVQNALIHLYGSCQSVNYAFKVFDEMAVKDLVSWSSMTACFANNDFWDEALALFREMQLTTDIKPDEVMMVSVISAVSSLGALEIGKWVHLFIKGKGLNLTVSLGTSLIDMYSRCGSIGDATNVFDEMPQKNVFTWTALISGLAVHGRSKEALRMFCKMKESGLQPDSVTFVGALVACSHGGLLEEGWRVFNSIRNQHGLEPMLEHYGCMVDLLGRAGLLSEAYDFIERMPIRPNSIIWRTLLGACVNYSNIELAMRVKEKISLLDPCHDGDYVLLSNVYGGANRWVEKAGIRNSMRDRRIGKNPGCSLIEIDREIHEFYVGDDSHPRSQEIREVLGSIVQRLKLSGYAPDTTNVLFDIEEEEKERNLSYHSEKLAVAFAILVSTGENDGNTIRVMKNLRICRDCHSFMKFVSEVFNRKIIIRDRNRFHHFQKGTCSCRDYW